ncbi:MULTISPECIES: TetR/AcrR family transcriptional regulator [Streptomyces]|uniref:TetR/AcrR family transcriptional regulator n=1 Tax=Streptomyces doudnae TaxID=3075536 RepID=A0ABD5ENB7_9ACTN|nr:MULTISPECIES: TetR/AcrR family transcriptional regulator [unclassified Streptomyces]MDT0436187.1 TetR/AcrR family transcriptional regulator [Streptomyces sp. DSM 41981]MYQ68958.1 TetR family transcriptional regulator [Streptomyces sp. SID4950]SCE50344.1 transcriptional regulator, TetR family [Streptomyces sp. SolWspMP-5a-2]
MTKSATARQGTASRNYPKGERRRAQIIEAAFTAFGQVGYRNASMVQLAAACGVSRAGLLHHFPTKESLLEAVLEQRERQDDAHFFRAGAAGRDGLEYFASMVRLVAHNQANPVIVSLFAVLSSEATAADHPARPYFVARYERARGQMQAAIDDLAERGLLRPDVDPTGLAADLISLIDGLQVQWLLSPDTIDMPSHLRNMLRNVIRVEVP